MEITEQREAFSRESRKCSTVNHPFPTGLSHRRIDDRTCHHKNPPTVSLPWKLHEERKGWNETPTQWPYYSALPKMFHLLFKASWWELEKLQSGQTKIFQQWQGDKPGRCTWILHVLVNTAKENTHARRAREGQIKTLPVVEGNWPQALKCPHFHPASLRAYGVKSP